MELAIDAVSWAGTLAIFAYGAALSYQVLHTTALACGFNPALDRAWPLGFESFMAVAAVSVLAEQRARPGRIPWYPVALTALAAGVHAPGLLGLVIREGTPRSHRQTQSTTSGHTSSPTAGRCYRLGGAALNWPASGLQQPNKPLDTQRRGQRAA